MYLIWSVSPVRGNDLLERRHAVRGCLFEVETFTSFQNSEPVRDRDRADLGMAKKLIAFQQRNAIPAQRIAELRIGFADADEPEFGICADDRQFGGARGSG
jgi:hypothetical protein